MFSGNPGDISITLSINGQEVVHCLRHLSVFEDLKKPYTVIQGVFFDYGNLLNNIPIKQNAILRAVFYQAPDQQPVYSGLWILSNIKVHKASEGLKTLYWTFQGYSPHMFALPRVQKAYGEIPMSSVVADLFDNYLPGKIKGNLNVRAPSRNMAGNHNMPYQVDNQPVWTAIRKAMQACVSRVDSSSVYVLFENRTAFYLDTLEHMIDSPITDTGSIPAVYSERLAGANFLTDPALIQSTIISLRKEDMLDMTAMIQTAAQGTSQFDIFGQTATSAISSAVGGIGGSMGGAASALSSLIYNSFKPPSFAKDAAAPRRKMAASADAESVTVQVPLNPALTIGTKITLNLIGSTGDVQKDSGDLRDWQAGDFLVAETRHDVVLTFGRMQGTTTVRGTPYTVLQLTGDGAAAVGFA